MDTSTLLLKILAASGLLGLVGFAAHGALPTDTQWAGYARTLALAGTGLTLALMPQAVLDATKGHGSPEHRRTLEKLRWTPLLIAACGITVLLTAGPAPPAATGAAAVAAAATVLYAVAAPYLYQQLATDPTDDISPDWTVTYAVLTLAAATVSAMIMTASGREDWSPAGETWAFLAILAPVAVHTTLIPIMTLHRLSKLGTPPEQPETKGQPQEEGRFQVTQTATGTEYREKPA